MPEGALFTVKISKRVKPGTYYYYCLLHREGMSGTITVVDKSASVPSPADQKAKGCDTEFNSMVTKLKPAANQLAALTNDKAQAGASSPDVQGAGVDEFGPKEIDIKQGESVTWTINGPHTISFNTPSDAKSLLVKGSDGAYHANPKGWGALEQPGSAD